MCVSLHLYTNFLVNSIFGTWFVFDLMGCSGFICLLACMTANPITWTVYLCVFVCSNGVVVTTLVYLEALCPGCRRVRRFKSSGAREIVRAKGGGEGGTRVR